MRLQPSYKPGDRIGGRYLVHEALVGGMGEVFLCFDGKGKFPCALKTFQRRYDAPGLKGSFFEEVGHWIKLDKHPNIVRCHYMDTLDNRPFMFLEWVANNEARGTSLRDWLRRGKLDDKTALGFVIDILRGLQHANYKSPGIVHRDLKPENVLIGQNRIAKITDFGLATVGARSGLAADGEEGADLRRSMSMLGGIPGTPLYMAPEQWRGEVLDERTDLYAVGCILYELLTGSFLYPIIAQTQLEMLEKLEEAHCQAPLPSLTEIAWAATVLQRCLSKNREERFASVSEALVEVASLHQTHLGELCLAAPTPTALEAFEFSNRGVTLAALGRHEEALADFAHAIHVHPGFAQAYYNRGVTLDALGKQEAAIDAYTQTIQLDPDYTLAYNNRGLLLAKQGKQMAALADYTYAIQLDPRDAHAYYNRGNMFAEQGKQEAALVDYTHAIQLSPNYAPAYSSRGATLAALGRQEEALTDFAHAVQLDPDNAQIYSKRGVALAALGRREEALTDYTRAIQLDPDDALMYFNRGNTFDALDRPEEALTDYARAIQLDPHNAPAYFNRGATLAALGRREEALADYTQTIQLDPNNAQIYSNRGATLAALGRQEEALADYTQAIQLDPNNAQIYSNRGVTLAALGRQEEALTNYARAIQLDPTHAPSYSNRGLTLAALGRVEEAFADYTYAIQLNPYFAQAYHNIGLLLAKSGGFTESLPYFERAAQLGWSEALQAIALIHQALGSSPAPTPAQAAFNTFQMANTLPEMRAAISRYPMLTTPTFIVQIEQVIQQQVPANLRPEFTQRLDWLKQVAKE